jgi:hypothetical protein
MSAKQILGKRAATAAIRFSDWLRRNFLFFYSEASKMKLTTLLYVFSDDKILLAMKKRGFGKGKWNGTFAPFQWACFLKCYPEPHFAFL